MRAPITAKIESVPDSLIEKWNPTTTIGWATKGLLHFILTVTWLLSVCWWLFPILAVYEHILSSYRTHKSQTKK